MFRRLVLVVFLLVFAAGLRLWLHRFLAPAVFGVVVFLRGALATIAICSSSQIARFQVVVVVVLVLSDSS